LSNHIINFEFVNSKLLYMSFDYDMLFGKA